MMVTMAPKKRKPKHPRTSGQWPKRLKALRNAEDITQERAAELTKVATVTWIAWENGFRKPSGPALQLLKIAFPNYFQDID